jgi:hypothetical protein
MACWKNRVWIYSWAVTHLPNLSTLNILRFHKLFDLSILSLCTVAFLGMILRSKVVFALPFINYNRLLEAHSHFGLGGWATLVIMTLLVSELLPASLHKKLVYQWLLRSIIICAWCMLIAFLLWGYNTISTVSSICFIILNYFWGGVFLMDLLKTRAQSSVKLLAICSVFCLILSTSGLLAISYIYFSKTFDAIFYRNALFTYLHFLYNGFFTLAIFALLFNHIGQNISKLVRKNIRWFSITICASVIPSLFITYLWQDPNLWIRLIAIIGCLLLLVCFYLFLKTAVSLQAIYRSEISAIRFLMLISMGCFMLKIFLQSFTVFPVIGNAIFGNRPVIMGFLHMVFLGFVTLFILAYFIKEGILNPQMKWVNVAIYLFTIAVILNETLLLTQGLTTMLMAGNMIFPWLLWMTGIVLFLGSVLIAYGRIQSRKQF